MMSYFVEFYMDICGAMTFPFLIIGVMWLCSFFKEASGRSKLAFLLACTYALFPLQGLAIMGYFYIGMHVRSTERIAESSLFFMALIQLIGFMVSFVMWLVLRQHGARASIFPFMAFPLPVIFMIFNL